MFNKKYAAAFKIRMAEQYLSENEKNKLPMAEFAARNNISDSTFNDRVIKHKYQAKGFCNITGEIIKLDDVEVISPGKMAVSPCVADIGENPDPDYVKMTYNGAAVVFHVISLTYKNRAAESLHISKAGAIPCFLHYPQYSISLQSS